MSAWFSPKVYCKQTESKLNWISWLPKSHNSFFERDELLLFLLPALKVGIDQGLQLDQVFVLAFLLDVLPRSDTEDSLLCYLHLNPNCKQDKRTHRSFCLRPSALEGSPPHVLLVLSLVLSHTYIKVHFLSLWDLGSCWPVDRNHNINMPEM